MLDKPTSDYSWKCEPHPTLAWNEPEPNLSLTGAQAPIKTLNCLFLTAKLLIVFINKVFEPNPNPNDYVWNLASPNPSPSNPVRFWQKDPLFAWYLPWGCSLSLPSWLGPGRSLVGFCRSVFQASKPNIFPSTGFHWHSVGTRQSSSSSRTLLSVSSTLLLVCEHAGQLCFTAQIYVDLLCPLFHSHTHFVCVDSDQMEMLY